MEILQGQSISSNGSVKDSPLKKWNWFRSEKFCEEDLEANLTVALARPGGNTFKAL
jgi:hypothetical protein